MRVLILGGTGEARALAAALAKRRDTHVVSSLAGRVSNPSLPVGEVRIGGFGGVEGLADYLRESTTDVVIDATHPFAPTISANAAAACAQVGVPLVVLRRAGWQAETGDDWRRVADIAAAAKAVAALPEGCVFVTTGRRDLAAFAADNRHNYLVRTVEAPIPPMPPRTIVVLDRGPYRVRAQAALMEAHAVIALVTKDSGGDMTSAKLVAARERGIPVIVVDRPPVTDGVPVVATVEDAVRWLDSVAG